MLMLNNKNGFKKVKRDLLLKSIIIIKNSDEQIIAINYLLLHFNSLSTYKIKKQC